MAEFRGSNRRIYVTHETQENIILLKRLPQKSWPDAVIGRKISAEY